MSLKISRFEEADNRVAKKLKYIKRVWITWLVGVLVGAIGIKPSGFSTGGLSLTFERPELVQGVIYLVCLLQAAWGAFFLSVRTRYPFTDYRNYVWGSLPNQRKTLTRLTPTEMAKFKHRLHGAPYVVELGDWIGILIPALIISVFNWNKVFEALKAILSGTI